MRSKIIIVCVIFVFFFSDVKGSYEININCPKASCIVNGKNCNNCMYFGGGPFETNAPECADNNLSMLNFCDSFVRFSCDSSCSVGTSFFETMSPLGDF